VDYFLQKALADKSLGLNRNARFAKPDSIPPSSLYAGGDGIIEKTPPPGAEGVDQGNGNASQYIIDTTTKARSSQY
jgi:penicillin-binding protein 1A